MEIKYTTEINAGDLDFYTKEYLAKYIKSQIIADEKFLKQILDDVSEEYEEIRNSKCRITLADALNLKLDDIADDAIAKISERVTFNLKVKL